MAKRSRLPSVEIRQDHDDIILISQYAGDQDETIFLSPNQALKLAYCLMAFARGQGPRDTETIEDQN
jgi:hypothetical protein